MKTFRQFQEDLNNPPPYKPLVRDYPLTQQQRNTVINSPLPKLLKKSGYSANPRIHSDVPIPDKIVEPGKKIYPPPSLTDDGVKVDRNSVKYHPDLDDIIRHPYVEAEPQKNIKYHMRYAPDQLYDSEPLLNIDKGVPIQARKTSNGKKVVA